MPFKPEGIMPPHITPFMKSEEIDESALRNLVHFWLEAGCSGVVPCGSNGEAPYLTREERRRVIQIVLEEVSNATPVIAGTGAPSTRETVELTKDAKDLGCTAALVVSPYYFRPSELELLQHFGTILASVDLPIVIYNVPKFTGYSIDPTVVGKLAKEHSGLIGVKDSSGSIGQVSRIISEVGDELSVLAGTGDLVLPTLAMGGKGAIVAVANVAPKICVRVYSAFLEGDLPSARRAQMDVLRLNEVIMKSNQLAAIKEALNQLGRPAGYARRPTLELDEKSKLELTAAIRSLGLT